MIFDHLELIGFGTDGWGSALIKAGGVTIATAVLGFTLGSVLGALGACLKLSKSKVMRVVGRFYTTVFRGIPEILIVYLFYFGGSLALTNIMNVSGFTGFWSLPAFATGVLAIGIVSGAYQTEAFRSAYLRLDIGQIEAACSCGMSGLLLFRRIVMPQTLRYAMPALGNIWQSAIKETSLLSVIGLTELIRQAGVAAGSTREPLLFYGCAALMFFLIGRLTGVFLTRYEMQLLKPWEK